MENNKYYTPSIDEFYVGFQCEIRLPDWQNFKKYQPLDFDTQKTKELLENGNIRCKYLDKSDIESLGFNFEIKHSIVKDASGKSVDRSIEEFIKEDGDYKWIIHLHNNTKYLIIRQIPTDEFNYSSVKFIGLIKNLSELRKLLKQLGIE